jgi:hypothetical protein
MIISIRTIKPCLTVGLIGYYVKALQQGWRDEQFPEANGEVNLVSRLVFVANTPPKHDISV